MGQCIRCYLLLFLFVVQKTHAQHWDFVGPGGGGALFHTAVSPRDPGLVFVSCDMGGSFRTTDGGASWAMFNLHSMIDYYVFDPLDPNTIYASSIALFRSKDKGKTWSLLYPSAGEVTGIVSKGDHASETVVTRDSTEKSVLALQVDPADSRKLYAVITIEKATGFYYSADQGEHWIKQKNLEWPASTILIDPSSPKDNRSLYLVSPQGIYSQKDLHWAFHKVPDSVHKLTGISGGYDSRLHKMIIYAIAGQSYYDPAGTGQGIYFTENGGETWENRQEKIMQMNSTGMPAPEWRAIATSATHPEVLYLSYNDLRLSNDSIRIGVARSNDYARTWTLCWQDVISGKTEVPDSKVVAGWINDRFGAAWPGNPLSLAVSPTDPGTCYATDLGRIIKTTNAGESWQQCYTTRKPGAGWTSKGIEVTTGYHLAFDPFDKSHEFIADTDIGLLESRDEGKTWLSGTQKNGVPDPWVNTTYWMEFDPVVKGRAWAVMSGTHDLPRPKMWRRKPVSGYVGGIVTTIDGGRTWQPISGDIGEAAVTHIFLDQQSDPSSRTLFACVFGKGVYKSVDGGISWMQKNKGIEGHQPFAWRIFQGEKYRTVYLIVSRKSEDGSIGNENDGALYRSDDASENWNAVTLPEGTNGPTSLCVEASGRLLLSAWGRVSAGAFSSDKGGGIFLSDDSGRSWKQVMSKDQHICEITADVRNKRIYACGFNGSAYFSEDQGLTWHRIPGYNFKWGKRVEPDPQNPEKIYIITFGGGIWHGPAKGYPLGSDEIITPVMQYHE